MNENYYVNLANMLGVKIEEHFYIDNNKSFPYKISEDGLYAINKENSNCVKVSIVVLQPVFDGKIRLSDKDCGDLNTEKIFSYRFMERQPVYGTCLGRY